MGVITMPYNNYPTKHKPTAKELDEKFSQQIVDDFLKALDGDPIKWKEGWVLTGRPINAKSNRPYTGLNAFYLSMYMISNHLTDPRFVPVSEIFSKENAKKDESKRISIKKGEKVHVATKAVLFTYLDLETGEYSFSKESPYRLYIIGRDWFNSSHNKLYSIKLHINSTHSHEYSEYMDDKLYQELTVKERRKFVDSLKKERTNVKHQKICKKLWDEYHNSNYKVFKEFMLSEHKELVYSTYSDCFKKYIPIYKKMLNGKYKMVLKPDKNLIGVYE